MSLTIHKEEMEQRQLALTIEVGEERVTNEMKRLARQLARNVRIPGFRPGKAPFQVILKRFGREGVRAQAVEEMLNDVLVEAMEQEELVPYARPTLDDLELEPTVFKVTVPLEPTVTLGDFREERKELDTVEISDEAVDQAIEDFRQGKAVTEEVDRPAAEGDIVTLSGKGTIVPQEDEEVDEENPDVNANNVLFDSEDGLEFVLDDEQTFVGTSFVDEIIGLSVGDEKTFTITYPDDYEVSDFAGRQAQIEIEVLENKSRTVPDLDQELIEDAGYEDLEEMKAKYRENLENMAEQELKSQTLEEWIDVLHEAAELDYPPAAIEEELDQAVENLKQQVSSYNWDWDDYLSTQETTVADMREQWREDSVRNFERALVLREFIAAERLQVKNDELEAKVDEQMEQFADMDDELREAMRNVYLGQDGIQRMANELMIDKAYERIQVILAGDAPDLDALEAEEEAERKAAEAALEAEAEVVDEESTEESEVAEEEAVVEADLDGDDDEEEQDEERTDE